MIEPKLKPSQVNYNFHNREHDFVYCGVAKCASMSMRSAMGVLRSRRGHTCVNADVMKYGTRLTIIRHPFDRLVSAWRYGWPGVPWGDWVKHVLRDPDWDVHTMPYADKQVAWANHVIPLEILSRVWIAWKRLNAAWLPDELPHQNKTRARFLGVDALPYREEILFRYADDLLVWRESCARFATPAGELEHA